MLEVIETAMGFQTKIETIMKTQNATRDNRNCDEDAVFFQAKLMRVKISKYYCKIYMNGPEICSQIYQNTELTL